MNDGPQHVIGLTGLPSSGKGEVAAALLDFANARGWRGAHLSFSDRIKEEALKLGIAENAFERGLLSRIATDMREAEGPGVLARRIVAKINTWPGRPPELFVVEALRHPGEVETLRQAYGDRFILVAVESEAAIIARRLIARRRPDESHEAMESEHKALELLKRELGGGESPQSPNVGLTIRHADIRIENNGSLGELRETVAKLFQRAASEETPA